MGFLGFRFAVSLVLGVGFIAWFAHWRAQPEVVTAVFLWGLGLVLFTRFPDRRGILASLALGLGVGIAMPAERGHWVFAPSPIQSARPVADLLNRYPRVTHLYLPQSVRPRHPGWDGAVGSELSRLLPNLQRVSLPYEGRLTKAEWKSLVSHKGGEGALGPNYRLVWMHLDLRSRVVFAFDYGGTLVLMDSRLAKPFLKARGNAWQKLSLLERSPG